MTFSTCYVSSAAPRRLIQAKVLGGGMLTISARKNRTWPQSLLRRLTASVLTSAHARDDQFISGGRVALTPFLAVAKMNG
jgi:hypothetical protein